MRKWVIIIFLLLLIGVANAGKRALLVGISKYPQNSGWCELSSNNDLQLLDSILKEHYNIIIVSENRATKRGIISAINDLRIHAQPGDTILIHFSGHGQQMWSTDKYEPDLLDEAFVPYDAQKDSTAIYSGENHLRDNELGSQINSIRKSVGSNGLVIVSIDACHSGSIDRESKRDTSIVRGTFDIFGAVRSSADEARFKQPDDTSRIDKGLLADVIYISACAQYDINREIIVNGKGYGSLTYSLGQALVSPGTDNVVSFLDSIIAYMAQNQPLQSPKVRTSIEYKRKQETEEPLASNNTEGSHEDITTSPLIPIAIVVVIISLIISLIWIRMKRK